MNPRRWIAGVIIIVFLLGVGTLYVHDSATVAQAKVVVEYFEKKMKEEYEGGYGELLSEYFTRDHPSIKWLWGKY